jgi:molecular chaperone HscB
VSNAPPTHFERLGLPARYDVSAEDVERNYLARSRELHPDFHTQASSAELWASMELTAALNEAYATLRDPFRRAEYLLGLLGGPSASEHKQLSPEFLEEMLDLRTEIEEIRGGGPGFEAMERQLQARRELLVAEIASHFAEIEESGKNGLALRQLRETLNAARYIQGLLRDLRAE